MYENVFDNAEKEDNGSVFIVAHAVCNGINVKLYSSNAVKWQFSIWQGWAELVLLLLMLSLLVPLHIFFLVWEVNERPLQMASTCINLCSAMSDRKPESHRICMQSHSMRRGYDAYYFVCRVVPVRKRSTAMTILCLHIVHCIHISCDFGSLVLDANCCFMIAWLSVYVCVYVCQFTDSFALFLFLSRSLSIQWPSNCLWNWAFVFLKDLTSAFLLFGLCASPKNQMNKQISTSNVFRSANKSQINPSKYFCSISWAENWTGVDWHIF